MRCLAKRLYIPGHFLKSYNLYLARRLFILCLTRYNVLVRASRRELIIYSTDDLFLATSLREILLALRVTPTPKAPPIISLLSKAAFNYFKAAFITYPVLAKFDCLDRPPFLGSLTYPTFLPSYGPYGPYGRSRCTA
ncbi:hypothetical protein L249_6956 [Ophiocordyceps polyrhachis-furcata BCC 54312]|uniref:Uncharacterized protein n=1 Tax=Ophiocordyceps polyrhachis-furcata BCC 54312 TaxID=1330021 RepID=A0A367LJN6_9HYPO|nr:hypothetical protein L249_6956 [Ophiocordyceps polyrhachis-furcata BCC 54312]